MARGFEHALRQAIDRGLIEAADIVKGDVAFSATRRRNSILRLDRRQGPSVVVKSPLARALGEARRPPGQSGHLSAPLAMEAHFYRFCAGDPRAAPVARLMPRLAAAYQQDDIVVLDWIDEAVTLWQAYREASRSASPVAVAKSLGVALGTLHRLFEEPQLRADLPFDEHGATPPATFELHRPHPALLEDLSPARLDLVRAIQDDESIGEGLEKAKDAWRLDSVIHGDIRSENVLVLNAPGDQPELRLVDWEFVQLGDPAWDLGAAFEDLVRFWLGGLPQDPNLDAHQRVARASYPLETLHPVFRNLWRGYEEARGKTEADGLWRAVIYSGARLVQSAWEHCRHGEQLSPLAILMLQVGAHLLTDSERAAAELYQLGVGH